jgi:hypothetical protein
MGKTDVGAVIVTPVTPAGVVAVPHTQTTS